MEEIGPDFGYIMQIKWHAQNHSSLSRSNMHAALTAELFQGTHVRITKEGRRHQGAAQGSQTFVEAYVTGKVED
jgi:hypothetical protein